ncbi:MAG: hypothetical protein ACP6IU_06265 [Candidatus Asgardarchaeia archaeon]
MSQRAKYSIKFGSIKIQFPRCVKIIDKPIDVDCIEALSGIIHCDYIIRFVLNDMYFCLIVEDTSLPELKDIKKIEKCYEYFIRQSDKGTIVIKLLHFKRGARAPILKLASKNKVELFKCTKTIDVEQILRKRNFL